MPMAKALIVRRVDEELVRRLKLRAARNNRSAEAEHREILKQALSGEPNASFKEVAAQLRALTRGRRHTPAEVLLRESRDER
jgi:antitoxin FitA